MLRRDLVKFLPALASAQILRANFAATDSGEPRIAFPSAPRDRLAVTSYPFRAFIESPTNHDRKPGVTGMDLKQFPAFVAEKFGVHNINPLGVHFASTDDAYIAEFRQALDKAGSHLVDLGLGGEYFFDRDTAAKERALAFGHKWIDFAAKVGSPSVRQHLEAHPNQKPDVAAAAETLGRLADYAAKKNIVINLENDNAVAEDPFLIVKIIEKVSNPYLRALPDFGNSLIGHDPDYSRRGVSAMLAHAWNMCHVKDVVQSSKGELQKVDLTTMFQLAKQSGYRGYYSMEFDTDAGDPVAGTQKLVAESLRNLG